ncbi:MAG: fibronectin type III domain-containing protein [Paludibacteraceae bacterium]|nr:fibronectin type III domain-containing protein [Paludibacteraceae bacterium]
MKKMFILLALLSVLCLPWTNLRADGSVTVNNGTATNAYFPVYFSFIDAPYMHSQFLIPSSELSAANGMAFTSMQFYLTTASTLSFTNNWVVTLMETPANTLSKTFTDVSSGTVVFTGMINWKSATPVISFNIPFTYSGGNLLVDMHYSSSPATTYDNLSFYGVTSNDLSVGSTAYSEPSSGTVYKFSPKTTFTYTTPPQCTAPQSLSIYDLSSSSADVSWSVGGGESQYQYVVVSSGVTPDWNNAVLVSSTSCSLSGLTPNTVYDLYVRSYCSASEQSSAAKVTFQTLCALQTPEALGTIGFEPSEGYVPGIGNLDGSNCWTALNANSTKAEYIPYVNAGNAYQGSNSLFLNVMKDPWSNADGAFAILPELDFSSNAVSQYEVSFFARKANSSANYNDTIWVGIMTDPSDISTFTTVGYAFVNTTTYNEYSVSLSSYTGTGSYVALRANVNLRLTTTKKYASFYVDNITVSQIPSCRSLKNVTVSDITRTSLRVNWQDYPENTNRIGYQVICSTNPTPDPATETPIDITSASVSHCDVDSLERNTLYYIHIRAVCDTADGYSEWISTSVKTRNLDFDCSSSEPSVVVTDSSLVQEVPWGNNYYTYYTQQIYTASELLSSGFKPGYINKVAFQYALSSSHTKTITIFIGSTTDSVMTTAFRDVTKCSEPVSTTFDTSGDWYEFDLTTPFYWDSISNVVVGVLAVGNTCPGYTESNPFVGGTKTSASAYSYSDTPSPDMTTGTVTSNRANIRLSICPLASPCPTVSNVVVSDITPNSAKVSWNACTGDYANKYELYYDTAAIVDSIPVTPQFTDLVGTTQALTGLTPDTEYYIYVRAICNAYGHDDGVSDWSPAAVLFTDLSCATPDDFTVKQIFSDKAELSWVSSASNWQIYISRDSVVDTVNVSISDCVVVGDTVNYTLSSLQPESSYQLRLKADCGSSDGLSRFAVDSPTVQTLSNAVGFSSFTITNAEVMDEAIDYESKSITASLRKGTDLTSISFDAQYVSPYCVAKVGNVPFTSPFDFSSPVTVRVLAQDTLVYEYWLITLSEESCATPYDVSVSDVGRRSANLNWSVGDVQATVFSLVVSTSSLEDPATGTVQTITAVNNNGECTYALGGLTRNTHYYIYISNVCDSVSSQWRTVDFTTDSLAPEEPACPDVTNVTVSELDETTAVISWIGCSGDYANTSDIFYTTEDTAGVVIVPQVSGVTGNSAQITGLSPYTLYNAYVRTHCDAEGYDDGISRWVGVSFRTLALCRVPGTPVATLTGKHTVTVDWTNTSDSARQADNFTYILSDTPISLESLDMTTPTASGVAAVTTSLSGLDSETTYHFYLRNDCGTSIGTSPWDSCQFTTAPAVSAVINLTASDITYNAFTATWESDTAMFADEYEWEVAVVPYGETPTEWTLTTIRTFFAVGLSPETSYDIYVRAKSGDNRSEVTVVSLTTTSNPSSCITVFDGADQSQDAPLYVYYFDEFTKVNTILPADSLTFLTNHDISGLTFYIVNSDGDTTVSNVEIYLKEVGESVVSSPYDISSATLVYSGPLDFSSNGPLTIDLTTPFHYTGGNLLIATQNTTNLGYAYALFAGVEGLGSYGRASSSNSLDDITSFDIIGSFAPKTTFCYTDATSCAPVYDINVDTTSSHSVLAHWYAGGTESEWLVFNSQVKMTDSELNAASYTSVTVPQFSVTGLIPGQDYYLYVRGVCNANDSSYWVAHHYTLPTVPVYTVSPIVNPDLGYVTVACNDYDTTSAGLFYEGATPVFTVHPYEGMMFTSWTNVEDGDTLSLTNPWTVAVIQDSVFVAGLDTASFNLNVSVAPGYEGLGTVSGGGSYRYMRTQGFYAHPNEHYHVVWDDSSLDNARTVVMPANDTSFQARFFIDRHVITANPNDASRGTVIGSGTYDYGDTAMLVAQAFYPYQFLRWDNNESSTTDTLYHIVRRDTTITAIFKYDEFDVVVLSNDGLMGTVTGGGVYEYGSMATLVANPAPHHHFVCWNNGVTTDTINVSVLSDTSFTATFAIDSFTVTAVANDPAMGIVTGSGIYSYGTDVTITATPFDSHSIFAGWSNGAVDAVTTIHLTSDTTVTANFNPDTHTVTALVNIDSMGTVTGAGTFPHGTMVTLTAVPSPHYHFVYWSNGDTTSTLTLVVDTDITVTAVFAIDHLTLSLNVNDPSLGSVTGAGIYNYGMNVTVSAIPANSHSIFTGWSNGETDATTTVLLTSDSTITANFVLDAHTITALVNVDSMGVVTGGGTYTHGTSVTFIATPSANHHFVDWSNGVTTPSLTIIADTDTIVTANFAIDTHTVTAAVNDPLAGITQGSGIYDHGETVILTAIPNDGYRFDGWSNGETSSVITFAVTSDTTLTANFSLIVSVDNVGNDSYIAYVEHSDIVISGAADNTVSLFDINGRLIKTITNASDMERITVNVAGAYIIRVGNLSAIRVLVTMK